MGARKANVSAAAEVDAYLAKIPRESRDALSTLRTRIRAAAPSATEGIGYGVVMLKYDGHPLVGYGAGKSHCALYVSVEAVRSADAALGAELDRYATGKGTLRFTPDEPLPAALVKKIVKVRVAEIQARWGIRRR